MDDSPSFFGRRIKFCFGAIDRERIDVFLYGVILPTLLVSKFVSSTMASLSVIGASI
jgi:hypothetical protein